MGGRVPVGVYVRQPPHNIVTVPINVRRSLYALGLVDDATEGVASAVVDRVQRHAIGGHGVRLLRAVSVVGARLADGAQAGASHEPCRRVASYSHCPS